MDSVKREGAGGNLSGFVILDRIRRSRIARAGIQYTRLLAI